MENAVQALKTATAVFIFVIAITVSFTMFSKAKATADAVITAQDKQKYLESPDLNKGILYTSKEDIESSSIPTMTKEGYRIVDMDDVISSLYRYSLEKYGITIVRDKKVVARFDSSTESLLSNWDTYSEQIKQEVVDNLNKNTKVKIDGTFIQNIFTTDVIKRLYKSKDSNGKVTVDAKWYTESKVDSEENNLNSGIVKHVNALVNGNELEFERTFI